LQKKEGNEMFTDVKVSYRGLVKVLIVSVLAVSAVCNGAEWVSGSNAISQNGVYGTQGVAASGNVPGGRSGSVSWIDGSGNFWLFGGFGFDASSGYDDDLNDLWKFDGTNWTWVSGSNAAGQSGIYGTKGVAASGNVPGARCDSVSWKDGSGNLWLFGGWNYAANCGLNDLWKFDGTNWTWVSGSNTTNQHSVYGTKGVAASGNVPGARTGSVSWIDSSGNLWLFGGYGYAQSFLNYLNDLWKFNGTNWTWVSGANSANQHGVYGTKGVAASGNVPGAREYSVSWIDGSGNLWLFGGFGYDASSNLDVLNDLWKFDGTKWTWVSGSNLVDQSGTYGTQGVGAAGNVPGARECSISWIDHSGTLWLFGGDGYDASGYRYLNDLWSFDGTKWTWVSGSNVGNQYGSYGTEGVAASGNLPGGRSDSVSWTDGLGNLWFFGGYGYGASGNRGYLNDLWSFVRSKTLLKLDLSGDFIINFKDIVLLTPMYLVAPSGQSVEWVGGPNTVALGTAAANGLGIVAGARAQSSLDNQPAWPTPRAYCASWTDNNGNFWLFGGYDNYQLTWDDMWKFDGTNWTQVDLGTDPNKIPWARSNSAYCSDRNGNMWFFGGQSGGSSISYYNDIWEFNGNTWTSYQVGKNDVCGGSGGPGGRMDASMCRTTSNDNLWLFGGYGYGKDANCTPGALNGLWWTHSGGWLLLNGVDKANNSGPDNNSPAARFGCASWKDNKDYFWVFGGCGYDAYGCPSYFGDLWRFDTVAYEAHPGQASSKKWAFMGGAQNILYGGVQNISNATSDTNDDGSWPYPRCHSFTWVDKDGNLWLFGGDYDNAAMCDLWELVVTDPNKPYWLPKGYNSDMTCFARSGTYGTPGIPDSKSWPGSRDYGASWLDQNGTLWLFGGIGYDVNGDYGWLDEVWHFLATAKVPPGSDLNGDGRIDLKDWALFAQSWGAEINPE
jgi:hypothetical protein